MAEFFNMDGYGFYVWTSWGLFLIVVFGNLVYTQKQYRRTLRETRNFLRRISKKS